MYHLVYHKTMRANTLTLYRRHTKACGKSEPTLYPNTDKARKADDCQCPINVHGYLEHHAGRVRHYSLDSSDWVEADGRRVAILAVGRLPGSSSEPVATKNTTTVKFAVEAFLSTKSAGTGKVAEATLDIYKVFCNRRFLPWCEENGVTLISAFEDLTVTERLDQSFKNLKTGEVLAGESRKISMVILRMLLKYCIDREWLKTNTATKIKPTKTQQRHAVKNKKHGLELHEYQTIIRYMDEAGTDLRSKTMIELMRYTGMRVSDAAKFQASELVRNRRNTGWNAEFKAQKNGKECCVPVPDHVVGMLKALPYLDGKFWFKDPALCLRYQAQYPGNRIAEIFRAAQAKFGEFSHPATAHTLRHTFCIQHLNNGVDAKMVADWVGDDLGTVLKHYAHSIRSTQEMAEDAGRKSMEAMQEKIKAMGTADKLVEFKTA
jgi:site-specific recombinase XerD